MKFPKWILVGAIVSAALSSAAFAASAATPGTRAAAPAVHSSAPTQPDCQKTGSDVSALIDNRKDSPNLAAARSVFQVGIMECMEGSDDAAIKHYQEAKSLLSGPQSPTSDIRIP